MTDSLEAFRQFIEGFTAREIGSYPEYSRRIRDETPLSDKEFHDPIWGTITLKPIEVFIADSPLFQRLRYIKQLGVVHWIYQGALHTRFEHSIGALHQAANLTAEINARDRFAGAQLPSLPKHYASIIRIAALVHDIGHGFMSHISEFAVSKSNDVVAIQTAFADRMGTETKSLSEIAAYYIVQSEAFRKLIDVAIEDGLLSIVDEQNRQLKSRNICDNVANLIVARKFDDNYPTLHQLISGPFDCDKIDYMSRDARMAGVPEAVDISRLTKKVVMVALSKDQLPSGIAENVQSGLEKYNIIAVMRSGRKILDEIYFSRLSLHSKVYRHHKVIAAEAMVHTAIDHLVSALPNEFSIATLPYRVTDDEFLNLDRRSFAEKFDAPLSKLSAKQEQHLAHALSTIERIRLRNMFVRAVSFERESQSGEQQNNTTSSLVEELITELTTLSGEESLRDRIRRELEAIFDILEGDEFGQFKRHEAANAFSVHPTNATISEGDIRAAFVVDERISVKRATETGMNIQAWGDAYPISDTIGFVFCPRDIVLPCYIAVRRVLSEHYGVRTGSSIVENPKISKSAIDRIQKKLSKGGYFKDAPIDVRPIPDRLLRADFSQKLPKLVEKFAKFQPVANGQEDRDTNAGLREIEQQVCLWLRQFPDERLIDVAIAVLEKFRILDRNDFAAATKSLVDKHREFNRAIVCNLGGPQDSSAIWGYCVSDVSKDFDLEQASSPQEALEKAGDRPILFVDDFLGSGSQLEDIVGGWFGRPPRLGEKRPTYKLSDAQFNEFRRHRTGFLFAHAQKQGLENASGFLNEHGMNSSVYSHIEDEPDLYFDSLSELFSESDLRDFRSFASDVAMSLFEDKKEKWSEEWHSKAVERCFGYGNKGLLMGTFYNIPAHVITILWRTGKYNGVDWVTPFLVRREKP